MADVAEGTPDGSERDKAMVGGSGSLQADVVGQLGSGSNVVRYRIRSAGLAAIAILAAGAVFGVLLFGDPMHNPAHFMAALFASFVSGSIFSGIMMNGRLSDALKEKENYRLELNRVTEAKRVNEEKFMRRRLSSAPPASKRGRNR